MKNSIKIFIIALFFIANILMGSQVSVANAAEVPASEPQSSEIVTRSEETKWYYRFNNGIRQKRLWSITYAYWKTDWINM